MATLRDRIQERYPNKTPVSQGTFLDEQGRRYRITTSFTRPAMFGGQTLHNIEYVNENGTKTGTGVIDFVYHLDDKDVSR